MCIVAIDDLSGLIDECVYLVESAGDILSHTTKIIIHKELTMCNEGIFI